LSKFTSECSEKIAKAKGEKQECERQKPEARSKNEEIIVGATLESPGGYEGGSILR